MGEFKPSHIIFTITRKCFRMKTYDEYKPVSEVFHHPLETSSPHHRNRSGCHRRWSREATCCHGDQTWPNPPPIACSEEYSREACVELGSSACFHIPAPRRRSSKAPENRFVKVNLILYGSWKQQALWGKMLIKLLYIENQGKHSVLQNSICMLTKQIISKFWG